jgi:hypothetical protein
MKRLLLAGVMLALSTLPVAAQTATDTIKVNTPFSVGATHDGLDTNSYNLYENGFKINTKPVTALVAGQIVFDRFLNGKAKGTYVYYIEAVGDGGVTASDTLTLTVTGGEPNKPGTPKIITTTTASLLVPSADGAKSPPDTQIVDAQLRVWTIEPNTLRIFRDGVLVNPLGLASIIKFYQAQIWVYGIDFVWYQWDDVNSAWIRLTATEPGT